MKTVLFICTGNYYRSRFAEEYFNHLSLEEELEWRADSRGLRQNMNTLRNVGPIAKDTVARLKELGIKPIMASRFPIPISMRDFQSADKIIAMCEREHRPMMAELFPMFEDATEYWDVEDLPLEDAAVALRSIQNYVDELITQRVTTVEPESVSLSE